MPLGDFIWKMAGHEYLTHGNPHVATQWSSPTKKYTWEKDSRIYCNINCYLLDEEYTTEQNYNYVLLYKSKKH